MNAFEEESIPPLIKVGLHNGEEPQGTLESHRISWISGSFTAQLCYPEQKVYPISATVYLPVKWRC